KHFPGLGSTTVHTDDGVAVTRRSRAQLLATELPPFRAAVAAGTDLVMTGHLVAPALDPAGTPASLSAPVVTGLLRHELGYAGVLTTDAWTAGALAGIPVAQRTVRALQAGNDLLLMPPDLAGAERAVADAVRRGTVSRARLDESVTRIVRLKTRLGLFGRPYPGIGAAARSVRTPAQRRAGWGGAAAARAPRGPPGPQRPADPPAGRPAAAAGVGPRLGRRRHPAAGRPAGRPRPGHPAGTHRRRAGRPGDRRRGGRGPACGRGAGDHVRRLAGP